MLQITDKNVGVVGWVKPGNQHERQHNEAAASLALTEWEVLEFSTFHLQRSTLSTFYTFVCVRNRPMTTSTATLLLH